MSDEIVVTEYATKADLMQVCHETEDMLNALRIALNTQAEVLACHRYLLKHFIPEPLLEAAVNDYAKNRQQEIAEVEAKEVEAAAPIDPKKAN